MDSHTHLLTLGTGPDREEIRLTAGEEGTPAASYLQDECGDMLAWWDFDIEGWVLDEYCHGVTWTLEAV